MNGLDLFSGIGGISYALRDHVRPVAYCEIDPYCQGVLLSRMAGGEMEIAPIWDDIRTFPTSEFTKRDIDIIFGGFPCQDISIAGHGKGLEGERSGLFFEIVRLAKEIKPKFIFLENVPAITRRGGYKVIKTLASLGYLCRWIVKSCKEVGSPQNRERWFCLAYSNGKPSIETDSRTEPIEKGEQAWLRSTGQNRRNTSVAYWEENKSPFLGMDDDVPFRVDRARALGNAVCVSQCKAAFEELMGITPAKP